MLEEKVGQVMQEQKNTLYKNRFHSQDVYELVSKSIIDLHYDNEPTIEK